MAFLSTPVLDYSERGLLNCVFSLQYPAEIHCLLRIVAQMRSQIRIHRNSTRTFPQIGSNNLSGLQSGPNPCEAHPSVNTATE
jgi:hypothetical protein